MFYIPFFYATTKSIKLIYSTILSFILDYFAIVIICLKKTTE